MAEIAIISFTNYPKGQTRPCMTAVMAYTRQDTKTLWQGQSLVSGINCTPQSAYNDFLSTKLLYHKNDKTLFFHMVQSHPKEAEVDPVTAHAAAMKLAEYFVGREVLVCTHVDRDHVHSHFIINSVSLEDGRKLHTAESQLQELRQRNDQICMQFGLPVFRQGQKRKKVKSMSTAEYHTAAKGGSWKFRLMNTIDDCMRFSRSREEFITLMRGEGYDVRWGKSRQNITYTIPSGMKCRYDRLHDEKYLKEAMEREFGIRRKILAGGIEAAEHAGGTPEAIGTAVARAAGNTSDTGGVARPADEAQRTVPRDNGAERAADAACQKADHLRDTGTGGGNNETVILDTHNPRTGWEAERAALLAPPTQTQTAALVPGAVVDSGDLAGLVGGVVELGYALERNQDTAPVIDATTKLPRHERGKKRKLASGQKADDHEDGQTVQQTMY